MYSSITQQEAAACRLAGLRTAPTARSVAPVKPIRGLSPMTSAATAAAFSKGVSVDPTAPSVAQARHTLDYLRRTITAAAAVTACSKAHNLRMLLLVAARAGHVQDMCSAAARMAAYSQAVWETYRPCQLGP
jgi:hypothetical protein